MATSIQFITSLDINTSQSTTDLDNIFSNAYDVYKIVLRNFKTVGTTDMNLNARLIDNNGSVITQSEYDYAVEQIKSNTGFSENKNQNYYTIDRILFTDKIPESQGTVMYVYNPYNSSAYTFITWQDTHHRGGSASGGFKGIAVHKNTEAIRGIRFYDVYTNRPYNSGKILVYGVR